MIRPRSPKSTRIGLVFTLILFVLLGGIAVHQLHYGKASAKSLAMMVEGTLLAGPKDTILLTATTGQGSESLGSIRPHETSFEIGWACLGPGTFTISGILQSSDCQGSGSIYFSTQKGVIPIKVVAGPSMKWEMGISSSAK